MSVRSGREPGMRFRNIAGRSALAFLVELLPKHLVTEWFASKDAPPIRIANKTVLYLLGVLPSTPLPVKHPQCTYETPLLQVFRLRMTALHRQLGASVKAETLDMLTDYWMIEDQPRMRVVCTIGMREVPLEYDLTRRKATDWCIVNAESYNEGELVSAQKGMQFKLFRAYEVSNERPDFDGTVEFPDYADMPKDMQTLYVQGRS